MTTKRRGTEAKKWPYLPGQAILLVGAIAILAGTALPWAVVLRQSVWGSPLAITWTMWAGLITLAASAVRWRTIVLISAVAGGGNTVVFAIWQTARILDRCPLSLECIPGPGLGFLLAGGGAALYQSARLLRARA